jgi:hypothetical protein
LQNYEIKPSIEWLEKDLMRAHESHNKAILVFTHGYDDDCFQRSDPGFKRFCGLMSEFRVAAVFAGHMHTECGRLTGKIGPSDIPVFRSGAASQQTYLVADIDLQAQKMTVTAYDGKDPKHHDSRDKYVAKESWSEGLQVW